MYIFNLSHFSDYVSVIADFINCQLSVLYLLAAVVL